MLLIPVQKQLGLQIVHMALLIPVQKQLGLQIVHMALLPAAYIQKQLALFLYG